MSSSATLPAPNEAKPLSEVERIVDTFIAPSKTFSDIRRNASWWAPWLLMTIVGFIWVYEVDKKIGFDKVVENQMQLSPKQAAKLEQLPPDQRAAQMETIVKFNRVIAYGYPVFSLIFAAIMAGVLLATFKFGLGASLAFKQSFAISMYAFLPGLVKVLISMLIIAIGGGEGFTFQNPVASNLGALVDPSTSQFLHSVLMSIDLFTIWTLVLTGIGYACLTRVKRGTCMGVVFGWWVVFTLVTSGLGALFS
jgi:hypothetical protein